MPADSRLPSHTTIGAMLSGWLGGRMPKRYILSFIYFSRALAVIFAISIAFATDPEWPSFRGPSSNPAVANSNLPEKWSKSENVEWTTDIPGLGWSSPIVSGKSVFLNPRLSEEARAIEADFAIGFFESGGDIERAETIQRIRWPTDPS